MILKINTETHYSNKSYTKYTSFSALVIYIYIYIYTVYKHLVNLEKAPVSYNDP